MGKAFVAVCCALLARCPILGTVGDAVADLRSIIHSDPEIHSGDPVFVGTRVPVRTLLDYIEGGDSLDVFLDNFPSVTREQAVAFLEEATRTALAQIA
jgi:uncharacterized protein (DUF433 family)